MSYFKSLDLLPEDPLFAIPPLFAVDPRSDKIDLSLGIYHDEQGICTVLEAVRQAEKLLLEKGHDKKYLPMDGSAPFIEQTLKLIFGPSATRESIYAAQTIGGTGALGVCAKLMKQQVSGDIYLSDPSWPNHRLIFASAGITVNRYPYYNPLTETFEFQGMCEAIRNMPSGATILLQSCCHNPSGVDPSFEQWQELSRIILERKLLVFFDAAYQGFADNLEKDVQPVRYFYEQGHEMMVAYSFSKNMGLYGERVGLLAIVTQQPDVRLRIRSHVKQIIRSIYSTPPLHGARIAALILEKASLREKWLEELAAMRTRVQEVRTQFAQALNERLKGKKDFSFLQKQRGLFSFCGLTSEQTEFIRQKYGVFMPASGRINLAAINPNNLEHLVNSLCNLYNE